MTTRVWTIHDTKSRLEPRLTFFPRFLRSLRSLREAFSTLGARPFCDGQRGRNGPGAKSSGSSDASSKIAEAIADMSIPSLSLYFPRLTARLPIRSQSKLHPPNSLSLLKHSTAPHCHSQ
jgi:hypothetical protein